MLIVSVFIRPKGLNESVICIVEPNARYMLEKRLLYTAVSRAKKLILIGNQPLFEKQVKLKQKRIRQTTLVQKNQKLSRRIGKCVEES